MTAIESIKQKFTMQQKTYLIFVIVEQKSKYYYNINLLRIIIKCNRISKPIKCHFIQIDI